MADLHHAQKLACRAVVMIVVVFVARSGCRSNRNMGIGGNDSRLVVMTVRGVLKLFMRVDRRSARPEGERCQQQKFDPSSSHWIDVAKSTQRKAAGLVVKTVASHLHECGG